MKIIEPNAIELKQGSGFEGMLKHIEVCGRTCYKSEDKITEDSCHRFVNMLREHAHGAMLEHGTVYLTVPNYLKLLLSKDAIKDKSCFDLLRDNNYTKINNDIVPKTGDISECFSYITTNYRVIVENNLEDFMEKYKSECTEHHYKRRTFKITCNRGVSHEFVRHRVFSFAQESQLYVNYSKDKFGNEIKVIKPLYFNEDNSSYWMWKQGCENAETTYIALLANKATPQEAREVLPNATATELIMTGFESDWDHFFELRCARDAHPQAQEIANKIRELF